MTVGRCCTKILLLPKYKLRKKKCVMKKLSLLLVCVLILSALACFASCGASYDDGVFKYAQTYSKNDKSDASYVVIEVKDKTSTELTVPETFDGLAVTKIDSKAFDGCTALKKVTISSSVTKIDASVFASCTALEEVVINATALEQAEDMFKGLSKEVNVKIGAGVTSIPKKMFTDTESLNISFEKGSAVKKIGEEAFKNSKVISIDLPSLEEIGSSAFEGCTSLTSISVSSADKKISLGEKAFKGCTKLTNVALNASTMSSYGDSLDGCENLSAITFAGKKDDWELKVSYSTAKIGSAIPDMGKTGIFLTVTCNDGTIMYHVDGTIFKS